MEKFIELPGFSASKAARFLTGLLFLLSAALVSSGVAWILSYGTYCGEYWAGRLFLFTGEPDSFFLCLIHAVVDLLFFILFVVALCVWVFALAFCISCGKLFYRRLLQEERFRLEDGCVSRVVMILFRRLGVFRTCVILYLLLCSAIIFVVQDMIRSTFLISEAL